MARKRSIPLLIVLAAVLLVVFVPLRVQAQPVERVIRIEAGDYAYTPSVFHANPGDRITIELVSKDVVHGLTIDGYPDLNMQADPGKTARVTFIADRAGTFKIRCSVPCGNLHPFMTGKISIGPNMPLIRSVGLALLALVFGTVQFPRKNRVSL